MEMGLFPVLEVGNLNFGCRQGNAPSDVCREIPSSPLAASGVAGPPWLVDSVLGSLTVIRWPSLIMCHFSS